MAEIVVRCSNVYTQFNLSPPMGLQAAAESWTGLTPEEIVAVLRQHLQEHRRLYTSGSGCGNFWMVEAAIRKALEAKYPRDRADEEPDRSRRRPSGRVRKIHTAAGGPPDAFVEGRAARLLRDREINAVRPSGLPGYEGVGEPIGIEDD